MTFWRHLFLFLIGTVVNNEIKILLQNLKYLGDKLCPPLAKKIRQFLKKFHHLLASTSAKNTIEMKARNS